MNKYRIGFWNYVNLGVLDNKRAVDDWEELGFNLAISFEYGPSSDKALMLDLLDKCLVKNIKVIISDYRTTYREAKKLPQEEFKREVLEAYKDFGSHPATFGFSIGDEPDKDHFEYAIKSYNIVKEIMPNLTPFINFYPYFVDESFESVMGVKREEYQKKIEYFLEKTNAPLISYDCYSQCAIFESDIYLEMYFKNLEIFGNACKKYNAILYTSLLSVGHWAYKVPTLDDIRWQLNVSIAHGCVGLLWFFVYERDLDGSYRMSPIDCFNKRTYMFDYLRRENNIFKHYYLDKFNEYEFVNVKHYLKTFAGFEKFSGDDYIESIETIINPEPFAISKFISKGKTMYMVTNLSQDKPSCIKLHFKKDHKKNDSNIWFTPGGMEIFEFKD